MSNVSCLLSYGKLLLQGFDLLPIGMLFINGTHMWRAMNLDMYSYMYGYRSQYCTCTSHCLHMLNKLGGLAVQSLAGRSLSSLV